MQVEVNSYHDIGDYLREVRESRNLDVRNIGQQLNIRPKYLVALEEGKIDVMPGKVYARGYLMNYAEYLGLDKDELAEAFDRMGEAGKPRYFVPEPTSRGYQPGMWMVGVALLAVIAVYYYWYSNHSPVVPPDYERVSPVPERLLDPIIDDPMQDNDDLYTEPASVSDGANQGDGNALPNASGAPAEETAAPEEVAAPADEPAAEAEPAVEAVPEPQPASQSTTEPAQEPAAAPQEQENKPTLPWQRSGGIQR